MNNIKNKQPKEYYAIFSKYGFAVYSSFRRLEQDEYKLKDYAFIEYTDRAKAEADVINFYNSNRKNKSKFTGTSVPSLNSFYSTYRLNKYYS